THVITRWLGILILPLATIDADTGAHKDTRWVTYETFGAAGDGITDDLPSICKAHQYANLHKLPVRSKPGASYHLGQRALTAVIATDTDWGTSRFIIDDSKGVEDHRKPLFEVRSLLAPIPLEIDSLKQGQTRLDLQPASDCLVLVENKNRRRYIRRGLNQNRGSIQKEAFILHKDGTITGAIDWDYDTVTSVEAQPIDPDTLTIRGGIFTNIANRGGKDQNYAYWKRNITIRRSNTEINGVIHHVTGEQEDGRPYSGFLTVSQCANVTLRNCQISDRKVYKKIGNAGKPVSMGTYGYSANLVVNLKMIKCRMDNIHDRSRWGVTGTNHLKNFLVDGCVLSRVDVHQGVSGSYIIRNSTIGHAGINAIGRGRLIVENCTLHGRQLVYFRQDYGSTWHGDVVVRNCRWIMPRRHGSMLRMSNDGSHDFGYPCAMPRTIEIDGLNIEHAEPPEHPRPIAILPKLEATAKQPFPYQLTKKISIRRLTMPHSLPLQISQNPELFKAVQIDSTYKIGSN
ncbi:MAG: hypothetical protein KJO79_03670, partial [Verrucomicrobiae bacterium]|nr:hypothetical protein [Verrucomicrobiae bacterium]NNJ86256.1 hypothetical protein [Akkermansiaceae bacterium]